MAQDKLPPGMQIPIVAWATIPSGEISIDRYKELKEMGVTMALSGFQDTESMQKALDLAHRAEIKLIVSCPELKTNVPGTVKKIIHHPALAGYFLKDEPIRQEFAELGAWTEKIREHDEIHFCFINLFGGVHPTKTEALGTASYAEYVRTFAVEVPVPVLSFDFYPVLSEGLHERWYESLEIFSAEARKLNKPFWAFALASSYNELHPTATIPALRLQLFSNLAYGARGVEYWTYWNSQGLRSAPVDLNGKRTVVYDRIKFVNKEIQDLAGVFVGSEVVSVGHTGTIIPRGTTRLTSLPWAISVFETEGTGALVSQLENGGNTFFAIVNRDLDKPMQYFIYGDDTLKKVLKDGSIVKASIYGNQSEIDPGDMAVYMFPTKKPEKP